MWRKQNMNINDNTRNVKTKHREQVLRYCPDYFIESFLKWAQVKSLNCYLTTIILGGTGLRPREFFDQQCPGSEYWTNIEIIRQDGVIVAVEIDIRKTEGERPLRSNDTTAGRLILVGVYQKYLDDFEKAYMEYLNRAKSFGGDEKRLILVNEKDNKKNSKHRPYTYREYCNDFKKICKLYVIPELREMGGEAAYYAKCLSEMKYGPYIIRNTLQAFPEMEPAWVIPQQMKGDSPDIKGAISCGFLRKDGSYESFILYNKPFIERRLDRLYKKEII